MSIIWFLLGTIAYAEPEAQQATQQGAEAQMGGGFGPIIWLIAMFAVMYFILIRPQKKQEKKQKAMLAALQVGDKVVTIGGICGKISKIKDEYVYLETGFVGNPNEKATIKMERAAIKTVETIHEETQA